MNTNSNLQPSGQTARFSARDRWPWAIWPLLYLGLRIAAPFIRVPFPIVGDVAATVVFLLLPLLWLRALSRMRIRPLWAVLLFVVLALVWSEALLFRPFGLLGMVHWKAHPDALKAAALLQRPVADLALITAAALLGAALAGLISDPKMLLPVVLVGAMVDYWGVYMGTTHTFLTVAPQIVQSVSAAIPPLGGGTGPHGLRPVSFVGFGDWLFLTMFLTVTFRYNLHPKRTFWALLALLIPAMLLVLFGPVSFLPAVVPMAIAIFAVNGRQLKLTRSETFATLYAILFVIALIGLYTLAARHL